MPTEVADCPSGAVIRVRGLEVEELELMPDGDDEMNDEDSQQIFSNCCEEMIKPGPYRFNDSGIVPRKMFMGDLSYLSTRIAGLSLRNPEIEFKVTCPKGHVTDWSVHPRNIPVVRMSEENQKILHGDGLFPFEVPESKIKGKMRLYVAEDFDYLGQMIRWFREERQERKAITISLYNRIVEVEIDGQPLERDPNMYGWAPGGAVPPGATLPVYEDPLWKFVNRLPITDVTDIGKQVKALDFGTNCDDAEAICHMVMKDEETGAKSTCGITFPIDIPRDKNTFFSSGPELVVTV